MKEVEKIIDLLLEGKITKEQAVKLIEALVSESRETTQSKGRKMQIVVLKDNEKKVSINLPINFLSFFIKTARLMNKNHIEIDGHEIPIDIGELEHILSDPNFKGQVLDVNADEEGKNVKVLIEII